ncbi:MAG: DUF456 domain-containing protein [Trueperaceae bacterium]
MDWMTLLAIIIFTVTFLVALAGIILPLLPGVPIVALGTLLAAWLIGFSEFGTTPLVIVLCLTALSLVLDYVAGALGAQKYGASRSGIWGSVIGSLVGLFFFPPFGFLIGALAGAVIAEMLIGRKLEEAIRSGFGVLVGTFGGIIAKIFIIFAIAIVAFPRLL